MATTKEISYSDNKQAAIAIQAIENGENVCLIGKAGTGKTTLLRYIKENNTKQNIRILAPTGIAAINAEGQTIHSLFKFPFKTLVPAHVESKIRGDTYKPEEKEEIESIQLLIIDEISMVRADILDMIDGTLKVVHNSLMPFGGVQVIIVGDPFQLPPVVTNAVTNEGYNESDKDLLKQFYKTPFFFSSKAYKKGSFKSVELTTVYRQKDEKFVGLLNNIREGRPTDQELLLLNNCYKKANPSCVYLTSLRNSAENINSKRLKAIENEVHVFSAHKNRYFPFALIPPDSKEVRLAVGARVMTTINKKKEGYVNGSLGVIKHINNGITQVSVVIELDDDYVIGQKTVQVSCHTITNVDVKGSITGHYTYLPIKLAWALTIHKSQGLTFSNVNICPDGIFAPGQLYVALSRCRSLEGTILTTKVSRPHIKVSSILHKFMESIRNKEDEKS